MGQLTSQSGVQQRFTGSISVCIGAIQEGSQLLYQALYLDDGILAGNKPSISRSLSLIQELVPSLGLYVNIYKCELYFPGDTTSFPSELKVYHLPPIHDYIYCANVIASKH